MDHGLFRYDEPYSYGRPRRRTNYFAWTVAILLVWRAAPGRTTVLDAVRLLPDVLRLAARLARDPATPPSCRVALAGLAIWIASPIDLIPEFVPVIGPLDDIVVAAIVLRWVGRRVGDDALRAPPGSHRSRGRTRLYRIHRW